MTLDASVVDPLIDQLAKLPDDVLDTVTKAAKSKKVQALKGRIPKEQIESLRNKYKRFCAGQTISFIVKQEVCVTIKVQAEYEFGSIADYEFKLVNDDDARAKALFDLVYGGLYFDDPLLLTKLDPNINNMLKQETDAHRAWEKDYFHIRNEFGVDPWVYLKDSDLCEHRSLNFTEKGFKWCPDCHWTDDDDKETS